MGKVSQPRFFFFIVILAFCRNSLARVPMALRTLGISHSLATLSPFLGRRMWRAKFTFPVPPVSPLDCFNLNFSFSSQHCHASGGGGGGSLLFLLLNSENPLFLLNAASTPPKSSPHDKSRLPLSTICRGG